MTSRTLPGPLARLGTLVVGVCLAVTALAAAPPAQAAIGTCSGVPIVYTISPGSNVESAVSRLCPGDTLRLNPGIYNTGYLRFYKNSIYHGGIRPGTALARITMTSADPGHPALIRGGLQFFGADYWRITNLRVQATVANLSALYMNNGIGWYVASCEFFGARQTNAMANVVISGSGGQPSRFEFRGNRVHDAAWSTRPDTTDHNVYVNFRGAAGSGGAIIRNVIWGHPHGAGIKLGNGGAYNALGPWGVTIALNTIYNGGRQLLLHGNIRNNSIWGNLLVRSTQKFVSNPKTTSIYVHDVTGPHNTITHNYAFASSMFTYDPRRSVAYGTTNRWYNDAAHDPRLHTTTTQVLVPTNPLAMAYGATGTKRW